jgi:PAS domain S-box-containing protein
LEPKARRAFSRTGEVRFPNTAMSEPHRTRDELLSENRRLRAALARERSSGEQQGAGNAGAPACSEDAAKPHGGRAPFQRIFRASPVALSLSDLEERRFVDVNPAMCRLTGYEREELVGRSPVELGLWKNPGERDEMLARLDHESALRDYEVALRMRTGETRDLLASFQLLRMGGTEVLLSVLADISARKQAERSLREANQEAEDLARFRSSVLTNVTHEVRTPLTVILGFTSILREGVDGPHRRFVDLIERSGRRLLMTLDSILDLAQLESGTLEVDAHPQDVLPVLDSVANTTRPFAEEKDLAFETHLPSEPLCAEIDSELLARALGHLLDNAVKFTDEGRVSLRASASEDGEQVLLEVTDTGVGIDEAFVPKLFDTFSQESSGMKRDYQGSGMGLTVAAKLIDRLDGEVYVESQKGEGSTFTVALPRTEGASNPHPARAKAA